MSHVKRLVSLIGKGERDSQIMQILSELKIKIPLKRPKKGEDEVNFVVDGKGIELCFKVAENLSSISSNFLDGEMVLYAVFVNKEILEWIKGDSNQLPFGLDINANRATIRKKLGKPNWSSPILCNDRWIIDNLKVLVCFTDDELTILQIVFSMNA